MKAQSIKEFARELEDAERFGAAAVRETIRLGMEQWAGDYEKLESMAAIILHGADRAHSRDDREMIAAYLFLYHRLWDWAREHMPPEAYHHFCEKQENRLYYWYL